MQSLKTWILKFWLIIFFVVNLQLNFSEGPKYGLKFLVLTSELLILFYEIYLAFTWLFARTKFASGCKITAVCDRVNRHDVLQFLLPISCPNQSDSKNKEGRQEKLKKILLYSLHLVYC